DVGPARVVHPRDTRTVRSRAIPQGRAHTARSLEAVTESCFHYSMHHYHRYQYEVLLIRTDQRPKPIDAELWYFPPGTLTLGTPTFFRRFSGSTEFEARRLVMTEFHAWVIQGAPGTWPQKCRWCATILSPRWRGYECERCRKSGWV